MEGMVSMETLSFYKGKTVLVTGHTGFKGSWLSKVLLNAGANVIGYSLDLLTDPSLFELADIKKEMVSITGDIRDQEHLGKVFDQFRPEVVIHMAAQPIVRESYIHPVYTYETNVMGTVNVMECVRNSNSVKSVVNVTTDKVYENKEWEWGYRENEPLNGYDPYSNSKSCSELVTSSYVNSFFRDKEVAVSTARAGNVIGGGDFSKDRIIPDCIRAVKENREIIVRNPFSIRPYQHVLEPLGVYLELARRQWYDKTFASAYNVGPNEDCCITTGALVDMFCQKWGDDAKWSTEKSEGPHEAGLLKLDCSKVKSKLEWSPIWNISMAIDKVTEWTKVYFMNGNVSLCMDNQIREYFQNRG